MSELLSRNQKPVSMILISLFSFFIFCSCATANRTLKKESQLLISKKYEIELPVPFHMQKENYEEGVIYYYSFTDSVCAILFEGALMNFLPMDTCKTYNVVKNKNRKTYTGKDNNIVWRKDEYEGLNVNIYYLIYNVNKKKKKRYDKMLDNVKLSMLGDFENDN